MEYEMEFVKMQELKYSETEEIKIISIDITFNINGNDNNGYGTN